MAIFVRYTPPLKANDGMDFMCILYLSYYEWSDTEQCVRHVAGRARVIHFTRKVDT